MTAKREAHAPHTGFVLAGGRSSRMGRDKALLPYQGTTLLRHIARAVEEAAGNVALIGDPALYSDSGYPVYPDELPGCGPLGGIHTALSLSKTDWSLVVACDMPGISAGPLRALLDQAAKSHRDCVLAAGPTGAPEPLCAVYHRRCLPAVLRAIRDKRLKMRDFVAEVDAEIMALDPAVLANVNTPKEWAALEETPG
jgi:molybdopterin-guanine dinucleotide biosynthesis protein A